MSHGHEIENAKPMFGHLSGSVQGVVAAVFPPKRVMLDEARTGWDNLAPTGRPR